MRDHFYSLIKTNTKKNFESQTGNLAPHDCVKQFLEAVHAGMRLEDEMKRFYEIEKTDEGLTKQLEDYMKDNFSTSVVAETSLILLHH